MANPAPKPTYIPIFGGMTAWAISTYYALGQRVTANGNIYQATTAGTSAGAGTGPSGSGGAIADNTVVWAFQYATYDAWVALTAYTLGKRVSNSGNVYQCVTAGTSGNTGGPTGTGGAFLDGNVYWAYVYALVAEVVTPTAQTADTGAITNASLAAAYFNKLFQGIVAWIYYLRDFLDAAHTWTAQQTWTGLTFFTRTATFSGDSDGAGTQSDITPSIDFNVNGAGIWKLVERCSDAGFPAEAKALRYVAGHGAGGGVGAETFVQNAVWDSTVALWSCIDTSASATRFLLYAGGWFFQFHPADAMPWVDGAWSSSFELDEGTNNATFSGPLIASTLASGANITAATSITAAAGALTGTHLIGNGGSPTFAIGSGAAAGGGGSGSVTGKDLIGSVTVLSGAAPTAGIIARVTFALAYASPPTNVLVVPQNGVAGGLGAGNYGVIGTITTTYFEIINGGASPLAAGVSYQWTYAVIG